MTEDKDTRKRLLALLDRALFNPVLELEREDFESLEDKHRFDDVKRKVAEERRRTMTTVLRQETSRRTSCGTWSRGPRVG